MKITHIDQGHKAQWLRLWQGYLDFYNCQLTEETTEATWNRFFEKEEPIYCLAAYDNETALVGFAAYVVHRSTWSETYYCYLEDLFVDPRQRGKGVARSLISELANVARERAYTRLYWATQEGNHTAQRLYDAVAQKTDFIQYRVTLD